MFFLFLLAGWVVVAIAATVLMGRFIAAGNGELPLRADVAPELAPSAAPKKSAAGRAEKEKRHAA